VQFRRTILQFSTVFNSAMQFSMIYPVLDITNLFLIFSFYFFMQAHARTKIFLCIPMKRWQWVGAETGFTIHISLHRKNSSSFPYQNPRGIKFLFHLHFHRVTGIISYSYPYPFSYYFNINFN